jgi:putative addiction module component (TIGR02574 family)
MAAISKAELLKLEVAERLELIEELWDSIAGDPHGGDQVPLTDEERALLETRLQAHRADPDAARPWAEVRAEILKQR